MSSALFSLSTSDSDKSIDIHRPRKRRRIKLRTQPLVTSSRYSDSESLSSDSSNTNIKILRKHYQNIPEKSDTVVLWKYQGIAAAFRRNIEGAENPFYRIFYQLENLAFNIIPDIPQGNPIPDRILHSVEYRTACFLMNEDLSPLEYHVKGDYWTSKEPEKKEPTFDEVNAALGLADEEFHNYSPFVHSVTVQTTEFSKTFIEGFKHTVGRESLCQLLKFANCFTQQGRCLKVKNVGGSSPRDGIAQIFSTDFTERAFRWEAGSDCQDALSELYGMTNNNSCVLTQRVPEAQVILKHGPEQRIIMTGEAIPSAAKANNLTDALVQTWEQALVGLIHNDVTYGLLMSQTEAWLLQIMLDHETREVLTKKEVFNFFKRDGQEGDALPFDTERFLALFKRVIGILYQHGSSS